MSEYEYMVLKESILVDSVPIEVFNLYNWSYEITKSITISPTLDVFLNFPAGFQLLSMLKQATRTGGSMNFGLTQVYC
jgi:hypothetical protein